MTLSDQLNIFPSTGPFSHALSFRMQIFAPCHCAFMTVVLAIYKGRHIPAEITTCLKLLGPLQWRPNK